MRTLILSVLTTLCLLSGCTASNEESKFTVTFNTNGGSEIAPQIVDKGKQAVKPGNPKLADYVFVGWFKEAELSNEWFFDFDVVTADITLFAKWRPVPTFTVTFNTLGGSPVASESVQEGGTATKPADPTMDGYIFGAWYKEPACTDEWDFATDVVTRAVTLFASWIELDGEVTIEQATRQTIKGWGVYPGSVSSLWSNKTAAHKALYEELGITLFRLELRGQYGNADGSLVTGANGMDNHLAMLRVAKNNGLEKYSMHVWSPPVGMKSNNDISGKNPDESAAYLRQEYEDEFCQWIVNAIKYSEDNGFKAPLAVSFQNEPDVTTHYQSCGYEKEQYIRVAKLLRTTLDAAGYGNVIVFGPEGGAYATSLRYLGAGSEQGFESLENDPEFASALGAFCSHSYVHSARPCAWCTSDANIREFAAGAGKYTDKDIWQTEFCVATNPSASQTQRAIDCFRVFAADMAFVGVNYWCWWLGHDTRYAITDSNQEVLLGGNGITAVTKSSIYYLLQKIYTNVPPLSSRVQSISTTDESVVNRPGFFTDMVAFKTAEGTVVLFVNPGNKDKTYKFTGLSGDTVKIYSANGDKETLDELEILKVGGGSVVRLPAKSVNIIVSE